MARSRCTLTHFTLTLFTIALVLSCLSSADAQHTRSLKRPRSCRARLNAASSSGSATPTSSISHSTTPAGSSKPPSHTSQPASSASNCFPALGFQMPDEVPQDTNNWWCDASTEYAFLGFSYEVSACQSKKQLQKEFADIRKTFNSRYVRLYGTCDNEGFYDDVVDAAWDNGLGVHALIWFGFEGGTEWKNRRDSLFKSLHSNPKAKFVTRVVQFGSEPLFDGAISASQLAKQVLAAKKQLADLGIPVTVSDMAYGYQMQDNKKDSQAVLDAIDSINAHMLPFFAGDASTAKKAWPGMERDIKYFVDHGKGKKIYFSENGWPSVTGGSTKPTNPNAVANVANERDYYQLLEDHCEDLKAQPGGGVGWFAHIYSEDQEPGYGIYGSNGKTKFQFAPKTHC
ncbi:glycoside hydrolase family 17 protein [Polyporus arcularius HHB13444]|uniref:glucan endo-1,3-beta-D-glucosidase n=2 Tax=Polyporaceae TaxID=5317 RepID=A0A5C3PQJ2_9APHY|nr:hypothetical protein OH76DRAFT_1482581 [Polyporus brumalis]TFK92045.1 glycoside hydrolase family 17 protein [Polyporus arcularius HHB13444]